MNSELELQLQTLPTDPGVYQFFDKNDKYIYIGKAKNLKKRVLSYFHNKNHYGKIAAMVRKINRLETIVVPSEYDALLLESSLIKEHQPKYNTLLKDGKTFPWIVIKRENFPRIFLTRNKKLNNAEYFGPFTNVKAARVLLDLIHNIFPIRSCNLDLSKNKIDSGKYKVCLEYHLGNCLGPCEGYQTKEQYDENLSAIKEMIKGNFSFATKALKNQMQIYAEQMAFEKAQGIKEKLDLLEKYRSKSTVINPKIHDVDVFGYTEDETSAYINYFKIYNGAIVNSYTTEWRKKLEETKEEILESTIIELRNQLDSHSIEIFLPFKIGVKIPNVSIHIPKLGDKKRIVELSTQNAIKYRIEKLKQAKIVDPEKHTNRIMAQMQSDLRMYKEPRYIEGFDNSNLQGTNPASVAVVFRDGKPSKKEYRTYNIKSVEGPNDFASMEEVILRRYRRLQREGQPLPDLIIIDGGKGQLSSAIKSLQQLGLENKISIISIAKKLEEIYFPNDPYPMYLDKQSETLKIIQQVRNESHRFSVKHHTTRRKNASFGTELELIPGIGEKTQQMLLSHFKSVNRIKEASQEELEKVINKSRAEKVYDYFHTTS